MKITFCDQCNGRNVLNENALQQLRQGEQRCQICGRSMESILFESTIDTSDVKLLFIDDEPGFLQFMDTIMSKDYSISIAMDGAGGLKMAKAIKPDIILLDINLPDIDGYELCRILKLDKDTCQIPILFITAYDSDINEQRGFEVGGMDYITKPISIQVLHARIALYLRIKQLTS